MWSRIEGVLLGAGGYDVDTSPNAGGGVLRGLSQ
jgi:hypothetical protein